MDPQIEHLFQRSRRETNEPRYEAFGNFAERFFLFFSSPPPHILPALLPPYPPQKKDGRP